MTKLTFSKSDTYCLKSEELLEIKIEEGVKAHVKDEGSKAVHFVLDRNSDLTYELKDLGTEQDIERSLTFTFVGQGARAKIRCICEGKKNQKYKLKTFQHHKSSNTFSDLVIKGVFHDSSQFFCDNLIRIEPNAQKVSAREQNKNLLIGELAKVVSIPKLEVEADDVSCQHGAAISRLDKNQLFYLQSRGMDLNTAKKLLIKAFLQ